MTDEFSALRALDDPDRDESLGRVGEAGERACDDRDAAEFARESARCQILPRVDSPADVGVV
jgi:hypothetical protein